jgi:hypothetical protein
MAIASVGSDIEPNADKIGDHSLRVLTVLLPGH